MPTSRKFYGTIYCYNLNAVIISLCIQRFFQFIVSLFNEFEKKMVHTRLYILFTCVRISISLCVYVIFNSIVQYNVIHIIFLLCIKYHSNAPENVLIQMSHYFVSYKFLYFYSTLVWLILDWVSLLHPIINNALHLLDFISI